MAAQHLNVFLDGLFVGHLIQFDGGSLGFEYDEAYRQSSTAIPLSMSIPLNRAHHPTKPVRSFVAGLLPDRLETLARWGSMYSVSPSNPFALLRHVGSDTAGAVQILPDNVSASDAGDRERNIDWLTDAEVGAILSTLHNHPENWDTGRSTGRWSLAGAQGKIALYPGVWTWSVRLGSEFADSCGFCVVWAFNYAQFAIELVDTKFGWDWGWEDEFDDDTTSPPVRSGSPRQARGRCR